MKKITLLLSGLIITCSTAFAQPIASFNLSDNDICVTNTITGSDLSLGSPLVWLWSVSPTTGVVIGSSGAPVTSITFNSSGMYQVKLIVGNMSGIDSTTQMVMVNDLPVTPSICMVTCDAGSLNNFVYWDESLYSNVDSFIVYRETASLVFSKIGAVSKDSLSQFKDTVRSIGPANGDPNLASYKYKIQIKDKCGNLSPMSLFHSTIHIVDAGAGLFSWAIPYMIEGTPPPVVNYILLCDTLNVDIWGPVQVVSGSSSSAFDPGFTNHSAIANWRVKTGWAVTCTPTRATINTSRSNIKHASLSTSIMNPSDLSNAILVYPNPSNETVNIELSNSILIGNLKIFNLMGQIVFEKIIHGNGSAISKMQIDVSSYSKGLYTISIETNGLKLYKKLLVN